jgi:PPOX class probable F420-dependent enzyme
MRDSTHDSVSDTRIVGIARTCGSSQPGVNMTDLAAFEELVPLDHGLCVVVTRRADGSPQTSVVNAGVVSHPVTGERVVAFVTAGASRKLVNLRADPTIAVVVRAGWRWATAEGRAELIGPDDSHTGVDAERLRVLLREIFTAAGGTHDDWDTYDRVMRDERRAAVLVAVTRVYSTPS